ncbi:MAG: extracellular solute-binding protein [Chloroflexi bacterium]|nr:extracellular solute-binding protein [Chloroflexota bacterium]
MATLLLGYAGKLLLILGLLVVAACAPAAAPTPVAAPTQPAPVPAAKTAQPAPVAAKPTPAPEPEWKLDWDKTLAAAKQEGKVVWATPSYPALREAIPPAFQKRFGIQVEYLAVTGAEAASRLERERAAGAVSMDVSLTGAPSTFGWVQAGWMEPVRDKLVLPEVTDTSIWLNRRLPFVDTEERYMFQLTSRKSGGVYINPRVVGDTEIKKWDDLLDPKWMGKISIEEPRLRGAGQGAALYVYVVKGEEWWKKLYVDQKPVFSQDRRQISDWLARGTYPVTTALSPDDVDDMVRDSLPVKELGTLDEQGYLASGGAILAIFKNAPRPNAAKVFVNWMASKEGQQLFTEARKTVSLRKDVETPWVRPWIRPVEGLKYIDTDDFDYQTQLAPRIVKRMTEILGERR